MRTRILICLLITLVIMPQITYPASNCKVMGADPSYKPTYSMTAGDADKYPILFAVKTTDRDTIRLREWFHIYIVVGNIGDKTAFDIKIVDEKYPEWNIETSNYSREYHIARLDPDVSIIIQYSLRILSSTQKNISLGRVTVTYKDREGEEYTVISKQLYVTVELRRMEIDVKYVQHVLIIGIICIIAVPLLVLVMIERRTLKEFLSTKKR